MISPHLVVVDELLWYQCARGIRERWANRLKSFRGGDWEFAINKMTLFSLMHVSRERS